MAERKLLIHIGFHKTGTTWLQRSLFNSTEAGFGRVREEVNDVLVRPHALDFDPDMARAQLAPLIDRQRAEGLVPVFSRERLCGNLHTGGSDSKELADRLARVFPGANVLIVLREQRSMILSTYKQYVRAGGVLGLTEYVNPPADRRVSQLFGLDHFCYDRLVAYYQQRFGIDAVGVLLYEELLSRPSEFVDRLIRFAGALPLEGVLARLPFDAKRNRGYSNPTLALQRQLNRVVGFDRVVNPGAPIRSARVQSAVARFLDRMDYRLPASVRQSSDRRLLDRIEQIVADRYAASNERTGRLIGVDLAPFGYAHRSRAASEASPCTPDTAIDAPVAQTYRRQRCA